MRGCIAFFLFTLFVGPMLCAFESVAAASTFAVNRDFYAEILSEPEIYSALLDDILAEASGSSQEFRSSGEYQALLESLNSGEWRAMMRSTVDQFFDLIEGRTETITINIPLAPLKSLLQTSAGVSFIQQYVSDLPQCRPGQEPTVSPEGLSVVPLPVCLPQNRTAEAYADQLIGQLPQIVANMPNQLTYTNDFDLDESFEGLAQFGEMGGLQGVLSAAVAVLGLVALGSWLFTGIIGSGRTKGRFLWLGTMLLLPSLCVLLIGVGIVAAANTPGAITFRVDPDDQVAVTLTNAMIGGANKISTSFLLAGGIPSAIGLILLLLGLVIPSRRRDDPMLDLYNNPTARFANQPGNYSVYDKPKNDQKPKNDDSIIKPL